METITIQLRKRGVITLPAKLRKRHNLEVGDVLTIVDLDGGFLLVSPNCVGMATWWAPHPTRCPLPSPKFRRGEGKPGASRAGGEARAGGKGHQHDMGRPPGFFIVPKVSLVPKLAAEIERLRQEAGLSVDDPLEGLDEQRRRYYDEKYGADR